MSGDSDTSSSTKPSKKSRLLRDAEKYRENLDQRGIIYLSRIAPLMKPNKIRVLLEDFGKITRIYLAEEDAETRRKRKESGGNGSRMFKEGWVEFENKKIARQVAETLNNTIIGGKKSNIYHDDIWNVKYLKNFKWDYLTEKVAYERRIREKKLAAAMLQDKKVNVEFAELVEKGQVEQHILERKRKRGQDLHNDNDNDTRKSKKNPSFHQRQVLSVQHGEGEASVFDKAFISNIFGKKQKNVSS